MRYPPEQKQRTRETILDAAAALFRARGLGGVGIDEIMAAAHLTRGGFYAHFESKDDLFTAVLQREGDLNRRMAERTGPESQLRQQALDVIDGYLNPDNLPRVAHGCQMAALSLDAARGNRIARDGYTAHLKNLRRELLRGQPENPDSATKALSAIAQSVGGVIIANALSDQSLREELLEACRNNVHALLKDM